VGLGRAGSLSIIDDCKPNRQVNTNPDMFIGFSVVRLPVFPSVPTIGYGAAQQFGT
jgi:hypothetical protein